MVWLQEGGTDKGREEGWPGWGFVAAWLGSVPSFRRSVCVPVTAGIGEPRVSNKEANFPASKLNSDVRPRSTGTDMFVGIDKLPPLSPISGRVQTAPARPKHWARDLDGPGFDSR